MACLFFTAGGLKVHGSAVTLRLNSGDLHFLRVYKINLQGWKAKPRWFLNTNPLEIGVEFGIPKQILLKRRRLYTLWRR